MEVIDLDLAVPFGLFVLVQANAVRRKEQALSQL